MIERVNPSHPDKIADRIAGAIVDYAYTKDERPKIAVEVLIGHNNCHIIAETSVNVPQSVVEGIVNRIAGDSINVNYQEVPQDPELAKNQETIRAGDNGIFKGVPISDEVKTMSKFARALYKEYPTDGKFIIDEGLAEYDYIISQSKAEEAELEETVSELIGANSQIRSLNPLGYWTGGINVDTGATNRKLGSDMGEAVTGGGLHGKDLSKADVAVNIYAHLKAQKTGEVVNLCTAIGDETVDGKPYAEIVAIAKEYIDELGGFEKLAEWGIV